MIRNVLNINNYFLEPRHIIKMPTTKDLRKGKEKVSLPPGNFGHDRFSSSGSSDSEFVLPSDISDSENNLSLSDLDQPSSSNKKP
jgi:hypothetical protein